MSMILNEGDRLYKVQAAVGRKPQSAIVMVARSHSEADLATMQFYAPIAEGEEVSILSLAEFDPWRTDGPAA